MGIPKLLVQKNNIEKILSSVLSKIQNIDAFVSALNIYAEIIENYRTKFNILGKHEDIQSHIIDSLAPIEYFFNYASNIGSIQHSASPNKISNKITCADLGTGAGLPGIPLALVFAYANFHCTWYLLERTLKKIAMLEDILIALKDHLIHSKIILVSKNLREWNNPPSKNEQKKFLLDIVTSRAFRPFSEIMKDLKRIAPHATLFFYKAKLENIEAEFEPFRHSVLEYQAIPLSHQIDKERHIVIAEFLEGN